jgi:hypothetical protein
MKASQESRRKMSAAAKASWKSGTRKVHEQFQGVYRDMPFDEYWKMKMSKWTKNKSN